MRTYVVTLPLFLVLSLTSCPNGATDPAPEGDAVIIYPDEKVLITGQTFVHPVQILGPDYDGLVIENCTFSDINGSALTIVAASNVTVRNCTFSDIVGNGIYLDGSYATSGIVLENNTLTNIWGNGINIKERHANVQIIGNTVTTSGIDLTGEQAGAPHHGIYMMGAGFAITGNTIRDVVNPRGHGISVRSSGTVSRNIVSDTTNTGIGYYSDHPAGAGQDLLIENNFVSDSPSQGISVISNGTTANHIQGDVVIRFNSVVTNDNAAIKLGDGSHTIDDMPLWIYGNLLVRLGGGSTYVWVNGGPVDLQRNSHNHEISSDPGFVDMANGDLHITTPADWAVTAVSGAPGFPAVDVDGDARSTASQYVGADDPD